MYFPGLVHLCSLTLHGQTQELLLQWMTIMTSPCRSLQCPTKVQDSKVPAGGMVRGKRQNCGPVVAENGPFFRNFTPQ